MTKVYFSTNFSIQDKYLNPTDPVENNLNKINIPTLDNAFFKQGIITRNDYMSALEYYRKGLDFHKIGEYDDAIEQFKKSLLLFPGFIDGMYRLANSYYQKGDDAEAAEYYLKIIELSPNHKQVLHNLAVFFYKYEKLEFALKYANKLSKVDPKYKYIEERIERDISTIKKKIEELKKEIEQTPKEWAALYELLELGKKLQLENEITAYIVEVHKQDKKNRYKAFNCGIGYAYYNNYEEFREYSEKIFDRVINDPEYKIPPYTVYVVYY
ncbi:tetratricopeptide repeat protein, partial [Candidatus Margulisiibacteriota bacterium]